MSYRQLFVALLCCLTWTRGRTGGLGLVEVRPDPLRVLEGEREDVTVVLAWNSSASDATAEGRETTLSAISEDPGLLRVIGGDRLVLNPDGRLEANVTVEGVFLGRTNILFTVCRQDPADMDCSDVSHPVAVLRYQSFLQKMFPFLIVIIVAINYINMGCQIDVGSVWSTLKRPLAPAVGCCCQFIFMPLVSYGIGLLLLKDAVLRFGFFLLGCCPGGNSSNLWTLMFDGDVTLSITMTFVSTVASIGMMPLWIFTLGRHIAPDSGSFRIPFDNIVGSLAGLAMPLSIGMLVRRFKPEWAQKSQKYIKPITMIILIAILIFSCTVNRYIFLLMTWQTFLSGALVAWSAYVFGALAAMVVRLKKPQIIAVAIEVAFQNGGIATVILYTSLPEPDSDTVIVPVVCQIILQGVPLYVLLLAMKIASATSTRCGAEVDKEKADEMKPLPATNGAAAGLERDADVEKADDKTNRDTDNEDGVKVVSNL